jgi:predicted nucleic acid-binding protein
MIVISDTTPLISLMKIGQLDLVHRMFGEIQIPEAVFMELVSNRRFPEESGQIREC